ncbi:MAG: LysR family transcriptional regulator [Ectothiorhodospiraceae bacterium]|nr:LysR family transcriptional regulator [Ectothiorhodospiraceae bacterium]
MDRIACMEAFAAVALECSFTAAGRRLAQSTKQISKQVAQLESQLGVQLFNRTTRSVALTEVGRAYLERCLPLLDQLAELESVVQERQGALSGSIRITAPTAFGSTRLVEALRPFLSEHPGVSIDLRLADHRVALVEEGFDLAVRIGILRDSTLMARKLVDMPLVCCASPDYLARHGRPRTPAELAGHSCLVDDNMTDPETWQFRGADGEHAVRIAGTFRANAPNAIASMATAGFGIARCPRYVVEAAIDDGRLELVLAQYAAPMFGVHAVYPANRHLTARVRALIDHLVERLR